MPDVTRKCEGCGDTFEWSEKDQRFYESKGFEPPKRCKPCRAARKKKFAEKDAAKKTAQNAKKGRSGGQRGSRQPARSGNRR
jgi:hypothetical protein